jgi:hypothetical protein
VVKTGGTRGDCTCARDCTGTSDRTAQIAANRVSTGTGDPTRGTFTQPTTRNGATPCYAPGDPITNPSTSQFTG